MAPKQISQRPGGRTLQPKGYARLAYEGVTDPENRTVLTAVGMFIAGVAFLHSSVSEILLPP